MEKVCLGVIALILVLMIVLITYVVACEQTWNAIYQVDKMPALDLAGLLVSQSPRVPEEISLTVEEREWVERVVMAEARGECFEGQVAVAQVIRDRVRHPKFPKTVLSVLTQAHAFADPYELAVSEGVKKAVSFVFDQGLTIFPGQLLYFMNPRKAQPKSAQWIRDNSMLKLTIGNHEFYGERNNKS